MGQVALLEEGSMEQNLPSRPTSVENALLCGYASLVLGLLNNTITGHSYYANRGVHVDFATEILIIGITSWLLQMIGKGKNWARITLLVLSLPGLLLFIPMILHAMYIDLLVGSLLLLEDVLQIIMLVLLFQAPAANWFKEQLK